MQQSSFIIVDWSLARSFQQWFSSKHVPWNPFPSSLFVSILARSIRTNEWNPVSTSKRSVAWCSYSTAMTQYSTTRRCDSHLSQWLSDFDHYLSYNGCRSLFLRRSNIDRIHRLARSWWILSRKRERRGRLKTIPSLFNRSPPHQCWMSTRKQQ